MSEYVCKHCGSENVCAEVEARGYEGGRVYEQNGEPVWMGDGQPQYDDVDTVGYSCGDCNRQGFKLTDMVVTKVAEGQLRQPCGRCDHDVSDHNASDGKPKDDRFLRYSMPCTVAGCECHDYYDVAVSTAVHPGQEVLAA